MLALGFVRGSCILDGTRTLKTAYLYIVFMRNSVKPFCCIKFLRPKIRILNALQEPGIIETHLLESYFHIYKIFKIKNIILYVSISCQYFWTFCFCNIIWTGAGVPMVCLDAL